MSFLVPAITHIARFPPPPERRGLHAPGVRLHVVRIRDVPAEQPGACEGAGAGDRGRPRTPLRKQGPHGDEIAALTRSNHGTYQAAPVTLGILGASGTESTGRSRTSAQAARRGRSRVRCRQHRPGCFRHHRVASRITGTHYARDGSQPVQGPPGCGRPARGSSTPLGPRQRAGYAAAVASSQPMSTNP